MLPLFLILFFLLLINLFFIFILRKENEPYAGQTEYRNISVVIAAKNEFENIDLLLESIGNINYPGKNFEVIIVDDNSEDGTFELTEQIISGKENIRIIKAAEKKYPGKKGALEVGIRETKFDYIMITDADCQPEPDWILSFNAGFSKGYDLLFGPAPFFETGTLINKISRFENLRSSILTFSLCRAGLPYSAAARSFGFTKEAYNKVKGYENTLETASGDDDLLIREAVKHKLNISCILDDNASVFSETKNTFKEFVKQKSRHTSTANFYLFKHKILLALWHSVNLAAVFSPVSLLFFPYFAFLLPVKLLFDLVVCRLLQKIFGYKFNLFEIFYLQIVYEFMLVINYLISFGRKNKW